MYRYKYKNKNLPMPILSPRPEVAPPDFFFLSKNQGGARQNNIILIES
jgi:hypothetical protein